MLLLCAAADATRRVASSVQGLTLVNRTMQSEEPSKLLPARAELRKVGNVKKGAPGR